MMMMIMIMTTTKANGGHAKKNKIDNNVCN
jgi:hypothetical protein